MDCKVIAGDIREADEKYICHQCNSVTATAAHLAKTIFVKFPYANIYKERAGISDLPKKTEQPGMIVVRGNGVDERFVIGMIGQYYPGKPKYPNSTRDGYRVRKEYFKKCLGEIAKINGLESVAFPYGIGCGAAGGDWGSYLVMIQEFAKTSGVKVRIYKYG